MGGGRPSQRPLQLATKLYDRCNDAIGLDDGACPAVLGKEAVIITRHGVPAGMLIGFEDREAWWEELLLRDPRFRARVAQALGSLREGRGTLIEELREKYGIESEAAENKE